MRYLRALPQSGGEDSGDESKPVTFLASSPGVKADGVDLRPDSWSLERFLTHPVILWAHNYGGEHLPIGTGEPYFEGDNLLMRVSFDMGDDFARQVRRKAVAKPPMVGASVGWQTIKKDGRTMNELLEMSIVPVPLDAAAVSLGVRSLTDDDAFMVALLRRVNARLQAELFQKQLSEVKTLVAKMMREER